MLARADAGAARSEPERTGWDTELLAWLPSALWLAGALVTLHLAGLGSDAPESIAAPSGVEAIARWDAAARLPALLVHALVIGGLVAGLARSAARRSGTSSRQRLILGAIGIALVVSYGIGWPDPALSGGAGRLATIAPSTLIVLALVGLASTAVLFSLARAIAGERPGSRWVSGLRGTVLALACSLAPPLIWAASVARRPPTFVLREVVYDFLAQRESWNVLESNPRSEPRLAILSPVAASEVDAGDKPALLMTPPCRVELRVPAGAGPAVLRAAAGVDKSVRNRMPAGIDALAFEFEVLVGGERVFQETIRVESARVSGWTPEEWYWHHVGGEGGVPLAPRSGDQRIELRTRCADPETLQALESAGGLPDGYPRVGFGAVRLERERLRERTRSSPRAPNIVLVVMDTQRADRLGSAGYARPTTPNLDRLAARGTVFDHAQSTSSWTWPATASILTGLPPEHHGVLSQEQCTLQLPLETLAEALQQVGFTTHAVSCNPLIAPERWFDQGFESFVPPPPKAFRPSREVVPGVLDWLDAHAGVRFFLYLHLVDPHTPHEPHPAELRRLGLSPPAGFPEDGMDRYTAELLAAAWPPDLDAIVPPEHQRWIVDQYDASVATGDRWVGLVLERIEALGIADRTVVAFTSDHGEELFDHSGLEHGHTLYQELVHVPLILAGPNVPVGERVGRVVSNRHLAPTLARLAGAELRQVPDPEDLLAEGGSDRAQFQTVKGVWPPRADVGNASGALLRGQTLEGLRIGSQVLHWRRAEGAEPGPDDARFHDLDADPQESFDMGTTHAARRRELYEQLVELLERQRGRARAFRTGTSEAVNEMIRAIGYGSGDVDADDE